MGDFDPSVNSNAVNSTNNSTDNSTDNSTYVGSNELKRKSDTRYKSPSQLKVSSDSNVRSRAESVISSLSCGSDNVGGELGKNVGQFVQIAPMYETRSVANHAHAQAAAAGLVEVNGKPEDVWLRESTATQATQATRPDDLAKPYSVRLNQSAYLNRQSVVELNEQGRVEQKAIDANAPESYSGYANDAKKESSTSSFLSILSEFGKAGLKSLFDAPINAFFGLMGLMGFGVGSSEAGKAAHVTFHESTTGEEITSTSELNENGGDPVKGKERQARQVDPEEFNAFRAKMLRDADIELQ